MIIDDWNVSGCDNFSGKPAAVQSVDRGDGGADVGALDVHVALGRGLVHVDVVHAAVLVTLLHHVVADLLVPVWLPEKIFTFIYIKIFVYQ